MLEPEVYAEVMRQREWLLNASEEEKMKDPQWRRGREWYLNAPEWEYVESSEDDTPGHYSDGVLTPVSLRQRTLSTAPISPSHAAHDNSPQSSHTTSTPPFITLPAKPPPKSIKQPIPTCGTNSGIKSRHPRLPAVTRPRVNTRSPKTDHISLDYQKRGVVVSEEGSAARTITFDEYMREQVR